MSDLWQIVVASSDVENRQNLLRTLAQQDLDLICVSTVAQCRDALTKGNVRLIFCDRFLTDGDYHDVIAAAACGRRKGDVRVVLTSIAADREQYEIAKRQGIFGVIRTPCRSTDVEWMIIQAKREDQMRAKPLLPSGSQNAMRERISTGISIV